MRHLPRAAAFAAAVAILALGAHLVPAEDSPTCPLCGNKDVKFENTPEGAFQKFRFAVAALDAAMILECTNVDEADATELLKEGRSRWEVLGVHVVSSKVDGDHAVLTVAEKAGREQPIDVVKTNGVWKLQVARSRIGANSTSAMAMLKQLVATEGVWRQTDSDRNGAQDYWTKDMTGFYYMKDARGQTLKYIDVNMANADRLGLSAYAQVAPEPKSGYWVRVMKVDEEGQPYAQDVDGDGKSDTNPAKYGYCAYPAEYGKTGTLTFIVNEEGVVYQKDLGPDAKEGVEAWPAADPTTKGWVAVE